VFRVITNDHGSGLPSDLISFYVLIQA
jgi:hypothetical protein